jgi:hypothetical protein
MSIQNTIRIINRVDNIVAEFKKQYAHSSSISSELKKMSESLHGLTDYLNKLDELKPNNTTNEIDSHMSEINLHMDILNGELDKKDFVRLQKGIKVVKTALKFHPARYSFFEFIIMWIYELVYFV